MIYLKTLEGLADKEFKKNSVIYYTGEDTVTVLGPSGLIASQKAPITYTKDLLRGIYENFCIIGALLSKNGDTWTIWNTNPTETGYWDPKSDTITTPSEQYGEVVAVCVGRGLWAKISWSGLTNTYKWAASRSDALYNNYHAINIHGNGWESTNHMFTAHSDILTGTIWEQLKNGQHQIMPCISQVSMNCWKSTIIHVMVLMQMNKYKVHQHTHLIRILVSC